MIIPELVAVIYVEKCKCQTLYTWQRYICHDIIISKKRGVSLDKVRTKKRVSKNFKTQRSLRFATYNEYSAEIPPVSPSGINFLEQLVGHKLKAIDPVQFSSVVKEGGDF